MIQSTPIKAVTGRDDAVIWPIVADGRLTSPSGITRMVIVFSKDGYEDVTVDSDDVPAAYDFAYVSTVRGRAVSGIRWLPGLAIQSVFPASGPWKGRVYLWDALTDHEGVYHGTFVLDVSRVPVHYSSTPLTGSMGFSGYAPTPSVLEIVVMALRTGSALYCYTSSDAVGFTGRVMLEGGGGVEFQPQAGAYSQSLGRFVAVGTVAGAATTVGATSTNGGVTWTAITLPVSRAWTSVAWSPTLERFVAVSVDGNVIAGAYSDDGVNWTASTMIAGATWDAVCWAESIGKFIAVAANSRIATSVDGVTWVDVYSTPYHGLRGVAWSSSLGRAVVAYDHGEGSFCGIYSDGGTLTNVATPGGGYFDACWSESLGLFVIVGSAGKIATSPTGLDGTWTARTSGTTAQLNAVVWSDHLDLFIAAGTGVSDNLITSPDGINWTDVLGGGFGFAGLCVTG